jgi:FaeA-like protein
MMLTTREQIFAFLVRYKRGHDGNSPTTRDIADACSTSISTASYHLDRLETDNRIRRLGQHHHQIEIVGGVWQFPARPGAPLAATSDRPAPAPVEGLVPTGSHGQVLSLLPQVTAGSPFLALNNPVPLVELPAWSLVARRQRAGSSAGGQAGGACHRPPIDPFQTGLRPVLWPWTGLPVLYVVNYDVRRWPNTPFVRLFSSGYSWP